MFRYSADKIPVAIFLAISLVDFSLYFLVDSLWVLAAYWFVMIIPKGKICAWNHHHQHTLTFSSMPLNRLLEFFYALHTGVTTNLWVLHHVLGHHHHFLDQKVDESRWQHDNGETMSELEYTLTVAATAYYRGYQVGKKYPKPQKDFLAYSSITFLIVIALLVYNPLAALFLFVLPMISGLILTAWATYGHHAGLDTDNEMEGSYNNLHPFFNLVTGNLGYHTAHHHKQGVHWSKLPELHAKISSQIPQRLFHNSWI